MLIIDGYNDLEGHFVHHTRVWRFPEYKDIHTYQFSKVLRLTN